MEPSVTGVDNIVPKSGFLNNLSLEVMPRTTAKIDNIQELIPKDTLLYIAHIEGTPLDDMIDTARRLRSEGFSVMPHIPARIVLNDRHLEEIVKRYRYDADVSKALLLAGGIKVPHGDYNSSLQMLNSGIFDRIGFTDLHVAGHPEGNKDIDRNGGTKIVDKALIDKQRVNNMTNANIAIVTQFTFESIAIVKWLQHIRQIGIDLPVHIGIAGPTRLQTLVKFAIACGVGPSIRVLHKHARNVSKLLQPFEPTELVHELDGYIGKNEFSQVAGLHIFPLGGIRSSAEWIQRQYVGFIGK